MFSKKTLFELVKALRLQTHNEVEEFAILYVMWTANAAKKGEK